MKSIIITLLCALAIARCGACIASSGDTRSIPLDNNTGIYLKGFGGVNFAQEPRWHDAKYRTSTGYVFGAALGYHFHFISVEGEFSYRHNTFDRLVVDGLNIHVSGDLAQWCGFGNVLFDVPIARCFAPYIGLGAGYRHTKPGVQFDKNSVSIQKFIDSANEWGVYQAIAGINCAVSRFVGLCLEYRYLDGFSNMKCRNHTVDLAASLHF